ncbi:MAG TPA: hypothetical protein VJM12_00945 [Pyrinomonadaceae bacterium]|nr:hypothetical protein [Pyrinomonadaceae bacterium]
MSKRLFLAAVLIITATLSSVVAQEHGPPSGGPDRNLRDEASPIKGRSNEMERVKRDAEKRESRASRESSPASNFAEIKEDFERIQIINADVLQPSASSGTPDYQVISDSAAELKKRAIRLKSNLFPPQSGKKSKEASKDSGPGFEDQALKSLLTSLDNSIASFTHSPIFQNSKVVNPEDSTNAQKELENIIKLSARIELEGERIKKSN